MNPDFSRILTLLRKEKGISQKMAAQELGISQALLSHYEKGIRECGLAFVVRAADFYGVSCDYLLGRSPERNGAAINIEELADPSSAKELPNPKTLAVIYNKKLIFCSLNILFDLLGKCENKRLVQEISSFLSLSVYRIFRILFKINPQNKDEMFRIPASLANRQAAAAMLLDEANASAIAEGALPKELPPVESPEKLLITQQTLEIDHPADKSALLNLIKSCESELLS